MACGVAVLVASTPGADTHAQLPQTVPVRTIGPVDAELAEPFGSIADLRELSDGRVVVADQRERSVKLGDFRTRQTVLVGGGGEGATRLRGVGGLLAGRADTTFMVDQLNARLLAIAPNGRMAGTVSLEAESVAGGANTVQTRRTRLSVSTDFIDSSGRLYGLAPVSEPPGSPFFGRHTLTSRIRRWDPRSGTMDSLDVLRTEQTIGGDARFRLHSPTPFGMHDGWTVAEDGTVIIVRANDYTVEWISPAGARSKVGPIPYPPRLPLTANDREQFMAQRRASASPPPPGMRVVQTLPSLTAFPDSSWPALKPTITGEVHLAPDGRIWVLRTRAAADDADAIDVIDKEMGIVERISLPPQTVLVGFGRQSIYTARVENGRHFLQRRSF